jgi:hypothetical protein
MMPKPVTLRYQQEDRSMNRMKGTNMQRGNRGWNEYHGGAARSASCFHPGDAAPLVGNFIFFFLSTQLLFLLLLSFPGPALAVEELGALLPPVSCGAGWRMEGKPQTYDRDTLSERIDGEAELYFPYGFDSMVAARYASAQLPGAGMDLEIYRMGSTLEAFGMFANYRQKDGVSAKVGAESNLSASQLYFYQGRNFVHLQITGTERAAQEALVQCARAAAARIPTPASRPPELAVFEVQEVVRGSERYLPESLLGYDFLNRGLMADAVVEGSTLQVFTLLRPAKGSSQAAFERIGAQLAAGKTLSAGKNGSMLEGVDPLYGPMMILSKGDCLAGALKFSQKKGVGALLERICR